jgi:hypothetical protein
MTVKQSPSGRASQPLKVNFTVSGRLTARLSGSSQIVQFMRNGKPVLAYAGLGVWDAAKKQLQAQISISKSTLSIVVRDAKAKYPLTIDPYFSAQELINSDAGAADWFGSAVAMTPDGNTAIIGSLAHGKLGPGATTDVTGPGAAYIFTRQGSAYVQTAELTPSDGNDAGDNFGARVAISADGAVALVTAPGHDNGTGYAYVFMKDSTGYHQTGEFSSNDASSKNYLGSGVAMSADGSYAIIGAIFHDNLHGAAYIFKRVGGTYVQTDMLHEAAYFGGDVAMDASGDTAVVGDMGYAGFAGGRLRLQPCKRRRTAQPAALDSLNSSQP